MSRKEEIIKEIKKISNEVFMMQMKDRWSNADLEVMRDYERKVKELESELDELEEE